jgi:two-component system, sensor histidine kinase PdtaS
MNIDAKIKNAWFHLLAFYDTIAVSVNDQAELIIIKDDSSIDGYRIKEAIVNETIGFTQIPIFFGNQKCGQLRYKRTRNYEFNFKEFLDYEPKATAQRSMQPESLLLPDGLIFITEEPQKIWANRIAKEMLSNLAMGIEQLAEELFGEESFKIEDILNTREVRIVEKQISKYQINSIAIPILISNRVVGLFLLISEGSLIRSKDLEILNKAAITQEIHHRVKNNLQTIASLLGLQMRRMNSRAVENAFLESINRISSIALIHEELSKDGMDKINLKNTISSIMEMILTNMVSKTKNITGEIIGDDVYINANIASTLSLCITELIQNAIEHAFTYRNKGSIHVMLEEKDGNISITVEDDGIGFNPQKSKNSLGLEIIHMITEETLKGQFYIEGHTYGTKSKIVFPTQSIK